MTVNSRAYKKLKWIIGKQIIRFPYNTPFASDFCFHFLGELQSGSFAKKN
jgi:hypothetical protein